MKTTRTPGHPRARDGRHLAGADPGERDVTQQEVRPDAVPLEQPQGRLPIRGHEHPVPSWTSLRPMTWHDSASSSTRRTVSIPRGTGGASSVSTPGRGQVDEERRAGPRLALDPHGAPVLRDDAEDRGEAHTRALVRLLGREERFEDVVLHVPADALARVGNGEHDEVAGPAFRVAVQVRIGQGEFGRRNHQTAAAHHRVAGVDREIEEDLLELGRIGLDVGEAPNRPAVVEPDVLAEQPLEHRRHVVNDLGRVQDARLEHGPAGKREQLVRHGSPRSAGVDDLVEVVAVAFHVLAAEPRRTSSA